MPRVTNISKTLQVIPPHWFEPGQTLDVSHRHAICANKFPAFSVDWDDDTIKYKTDGKLSHVTVVGNVNPHNGYGILCIAAIRWLNNHGIHVTTNMPVEGDIRNYLRQEYPDVLGVIDRTDRHPTKVGLLFGHPPMLKDLPTQVRVLYTMYETTLLPDEWDKGWSDADVVLLPDEGQIPIYRDSGVTQPIHIVPSGFDMANWPYVEREKRDTFTFMSWARMSSRKMPMELVQCFFRAFPCEYDVRLVMKTRNRDFGGGRIGGIPEIRDPRVTIINEDWPQTRLFDAVSNADCGVFLSRGEGFYQGPVQSMATGLPTVMINHSGCSWATKHAYVVGLDEKTPLVPSTGMGMRDGKTLDWWNPDLDQCIAQMRYVYEHRDEAKRKGKRSSTFVHKRFSEDAVFGGLYEVLNSL